MSLDHLLSHFKETSALGQVSMLLTWDQETQMPKSGASERAEQQAAMARILQERRSDPRIPEWIAGIDQGALSLFDRRNVEEAQRAYDAAARTPSDLAVEMARAFSHGQRLWQQARDDNDYASFAPVLARNIELKKEHAACLADDGDDLYDVLLDRFEPGATSAELKPLLASLRSPLKALRERIAVKPAPDYPSGQFPISAQMELSRRLAELIGYDFGAGKLDVAAHPFSSGTPGDARITTRIEESDPLSSVYPTLHEAGHALYTQGQTDPFLLAADFCSMGVHESQSRFWENQIGRSRSFADLLFRTMADVYGSNQLDGPEQLYAAVNNVEAGFIRTDADEVHYNLHILLRFELERDLFGGQLTPKDLEAAWNEKFEADFGRAVPDARNGILQDVHWSMGLFGYFPTYALGNIYAACLDRAMKSDLPDREEMVRTGEMAPILEWMREKIHTQGKLHSPMDLISRAYGAPVSTTPLIDYLTEKFSGLYGL